MNMTQTHAIVKTIKDLGKENENMQEAFEQITFAHENGLLKYQNNTYGIYLICIWNFITIKLKLSLVFLSPTVHLC